MYSVEHKDKDLDPLYRCRIATSEILGKYIVSAIDNVNPYFDEYR